MPPKIKNLLITICIIISVAICGLLLLVAILSIMFPSNKIEDPFQKVLIIGHTAEEIQNVYGEFDLHYYYSDEGYYNWYDPEDPNNQGVVLRRGEYLVAPSERAPDYRKYPVYYVINFNEQGVATEAYLWEMMDGG